MLWWFIDGHHLSHTSVPARQGTPVQLTVVFSWRVAMARHSLSLAMRRLTLLRLLQARSGQAASASWRWGGIAGRAVKVRYARGRRG